MRCGIRPGCPLVPLLSPERPSPGPFTTAGCGSGRFRVRGWAADAWAPLFPRLCRQARRQHENHMPAITRAEAVSA